MKALKILVLACLMASALSAATFADGPNLLPNPGFENTSNYGTYWERYDYSLPGYAGLDTRGVASAGHYPTLSGVNALVVFQKNPTDTVKAGGSCYYDTNSAWLVELAPNTTYRIGGNVWTYGSNFDGPGGRDQWATFAYVKGTDWSWVRNSGRTNLTLMDKIESPNEWYQLFTTTVTTGSATEWLRVGLRINMDGDYLADPIDHTHPFQRVVADDFFVCAIPEPGSLLALGTGLFGLIGIAVRKRS